MRTLSLVAALLVLATPKVHAQGGYELSWWTVDGGGSIGASGGSVMLGGTIGQPDAGGPLVGGSFSVSGGFWVVAAEPPTPDFPGSFYSVAPCRAVDTRGNGAPIQGGALISGVSRALPLAGQCGIPLTATAVSLNVTVIQATGSGSVTLYPWDQGAPGTSTINFPGSLARANNGLFALSSDGTLGALATIGGGGSVHLVLDINGYFE